MSFSNTIIHQSYSPNKKVIRFHRGILDKRTTPLSMSTTIWLGLIKSFITPGKKWLYTTIHHHRQLSRLHQKNEYTQTIRIIHVVAEYACHTYPAANSQRSLRVASFMRLNSENLRSIGHQTQICMVSLNMQSPVNSAKSKPM